MPARRIFFVLLLSICAACSGNDTLPTVASLPTLTDTLTVAPILPPATDTPAPTDSPSLTPSATITNTVAPTATTAQSRETLTQTLEQSIITVDGVVSVDAITVFPNDDSTSVVYAEVTTQSGYNNPSTADSIRQLAYTTLGTAFVDFSVVLTDEQTAPIDYIWNNTDDTWQTTTLSFTPESIPATTAHVPTVASQSQSSIDSQTCDGASTCGAMANCEQAYACLRSGNSGLDRDNDGVPCESICPGG